MNASASRSSVRRREPLTNSTLLMLISIGIFLAMYLLAICFMSDKGFSKPQMFFDLLNDNAALVIIACSLTVVMVGGGINISVGGVIGLTVMSCALFLNQCGIESPFLSIALTFLLALGIGLAFGIVQGFLVSYLEIQPFIVTLAGMFLSRGLTTILSRDPVKVTHAGFQALVKTKIKISSLGYVAQNGNLIPAKVEIGAVAAVCVVILVFLMLRYTRFGRSLYAVGGNQQSATLMGLDVKRTKLRAYILSSFLTSIGGICFCLKTMCGTATQATGLEMDAISSAVIGGTLLTGGVGNVIGSLFGVLINGTISALVKTNGKLISSWSNIVTAILLCFFIVLQSVFALLKARKK